MAMNARSLGLLLGTCLALAGCGGDESEPDNGVRVPVTVMTRNLYLGGSIADVVFADTPAELPPLAGALWRTVKASDFPNRAKLVADEIAAALPHLVALQEVELFRTGPNDFDFATAAKNAETPAIDFLQLLTTELAARVGARYRVVAVNELSDVELPAMGEPMEDVRMTDRDVILARDDVQTTNPMSRPFDAEIRVRIGGSMGVPIRLARGVQSVVATVGGATFTFMNTHLEVGAAQAAAFQEAQAEELLKSIGAVSGQLLLLGDLNSPATRTGTRSYARVRTVMSDAWDPLMPGVPGHTCCADDLAAPTFNGRERIDYILYRGPVVPMTIAVIGTDPAKRTPGGLFPSDHAGVVATVGVKP